MAVYAVGDIQGCYEPLQRLLERVYFDPGSDRLWCVGDLVNRGPDSLGTLRYLKSLGPACTAILGNHDLHLLEQVSLEKVGGRRDSHDTFDDLLQAPDRDELIYWLRHRPLLHYDEGLNWCMVHAGLHPGWSIEEAKKRAVEVEVELRSDRWQQFCHYLHHNKFPDRQPLTGSTNDHFIEKIFAVAVLTRSRYCTQAGVFNWEVSSGDSDKTGDKAWFEHSQLAWRDQCRVVYGHWAARGVVADQPHVLGLDSGCVWGGSLTLARLDSEEVELTSVACEACQTHD